MSKSAPYASQADFDPGYKSALSGRQMDGVCALSRISHKSPAARPLARGRSRKSQSRLPAVSSARPTGKKPNPCRYSPQSGARHPTLRSVDKALPEPRMFANVLIANRGEIACRIIRTARGMGIRSIVLHTPADHGALWRGSLTKRTRSARARAAISTRRLSSPLRGGLALSACIRVIDSCRRTLNLPSAAPRPGSSSLVRRPRRCGPWV